MEYYIGPLKSDCEDILSQFQRTESVRYESFSAIWRKMDFSTIFYGKMSPNEMSTYTRLALTTAYPYFLPPYTFQIRVGGLYLLYGLYHTQLTSPKEKIRIALKDWEDIVKFQKDAVNAQHFDVVYILRKLFTLKAFYFTAMPKMLFFEVKRKPKRDEVCEDFRERPEHVKELIDMETLEEMMNVQQHYEKMKAAISTTLGQKESGISLIRKDLPLQLRDTVMEYHKWQEKVTKTGPNGTDTEAGEGTSEKQECSKRASLLASIKSKSYGQAVQVSRARRHRQVEMDTSGSGTDPGLELSLRKRPQSLRARTRKDLIGKGDMKEEPQEFTRQWRLTVPEDKVHERPRKKKRFKW
ncbi:snRNA-activating protein complex subunit 1b isoform X1 [Brienomyrus brachyistius]|uniref:snRNA-activating protein complex subunit 1b isoform X1 n=1 Tax=Brienomyrus brachyistius TaxID=42636 RepID=UPI0020B26717|nr:snRNA-activating protein complex subunit 1b isoform X1 [Brienomyrus brachyistius]